MTLLELYLQLPWAISRKHRDDDGECYVVLSVDELEGFAVAAPEDEIEERFWEGLELFLQSYIDDNLVPPLPEPLSKRLEVVLQENRLVDSVPQAGDADRKVATISLAGMFNPSEPLNSRDLAGVP